MFFAMALFTKENSIFLVPVYAFMFFIFGIPDKKKLFIFAIVWIGLLALWRIMLTSVIKTTLTAGHDFISTLKSFTYAMFMFIGKSVIPVNQSVAPVMDNVSVIAGVIAVILISLAWYKWGVKNKKIALLGIIIYLILLAVPVWFGATLPTGEHLEHRVYTSMIGLLIMAGQLNINIHLKSVRYVFTAVLILLGLKTVIRMSVYNDGLSYITEAVEDCNTNYFYHTRMGNFLYDDKQYAEALKSFDLAIALYDKKPQVFNERANTYRALNRKNEAIEDYTKAYELGKNPQVLLYRCLTYKQFGDIGNAMKDLMTLNECCREYVPNGLEAELMGKWVMYQLEELNKLIAVEPNNALLYVNRAKFFVDRRMGPEALADLKKACELEPENEVYKGYYKELNSSFPH